MNRRKKGIQILKAQAKRANAKLASKTKPKYISKAERAKLEAGSQPVTAEVAKTM
jgi:hypothetical protein